MRVLLYTEDKATEMVWGGEGKRHSLTCFEEKKLRKRTLKVIKLRKEARRRNEASKDWHSLQSDPYQINGRTVLVSDAFSR